MHKTDHELFSTFKEDSLGFITYCKPRYAFNFWSSFYFIVFFV